MLFNSISFLFFFPLVVFLYFATPYKYRWILLLVASYYFYMCWKVEYIVLIMISTIVDYFVAIKMSETEVKADRKKWLYLSLFVNLGFLFTFKYFNFFGGSINALFQQFNMLGPIPGFHLLLPVGISFYTFQTLSYSIDVYNDKVKAERHLGIFALYVSFFPQLVAGPIERPSHLLPQFRQKFDYNYERIVAGLKMMAWGFFMKLVIADRVAPIVNEVFNHPNKYEGLQVIIATIFFSFQIFCDFAGYSIIAIGTAKVLGYDLMQNFKRPYFAASIKDFWARWHISLSTWFRDYVYIPLGGNRVVKWRWYYNLFITFLVSGLWHGANWTFVVWGALHGFYLVFAIVSEPSRKKIADQLGISKIPALHNFLQIATTFALAVFAWIFFRANNITDAFTLIGNMFVIKAEQFDLSLIKGFTGFDLLLCFAVILLMEIVHAQEEWGKTRSFMYSSSTAIRWATYLLLALITLGFGVFTSSAFIYFQF